jgi:glyoxylase-like metal-dependent hydrolase (beta-lactamase superfamily II)
MLAPGWRVEVLHTPGHSEGHLSLWDPRSRTLIIADAAMGRALPYVDGEPALAATYTHPGPYAASNGLLRQRGPELLLTAHFPAMRGDEIGRFLDDSAGLVADIDRTLLGAVCSRPQSLRDLVDAVDTALGPLPAETKSTWAFPVEGHMNELAAAGRVVAGRDGDKIVWTATDRSAHAA